MKYQLLRKNHWFSFLEAVIQPCLVGNLGIAKVHWLHEEERKPYEFMFDTADQQSFLEVAAAIENGDIEVTKMEPLAGTNRFYRLEFERVTIKANHPVVEFLPASEFRFTPEAKNVQECKFVAHRKIVQGDYLYRKQEEGVYANVKEALEALGDTKATASEVYHNDELSNIRERLTDSDEATRNVELYECYLKLDYNNDGKIENLIVHCVDNVLLSVQENKPGIAPFFIAQAVQDANMIFNPKTSYLQDLEQMQDLKTALIRQIIIGVAKANIPQKFVKENSVDADALMAGEEVIMTSDRPSDVVFIPPVNQLSPLSFDLVNYAQNDIEANSGSTRYNQGLDANSLNKTATGIKAIMGASEKKIKLLARRISENFLCSIFRYLIILNQIYMKPEQMFRLTNKNVSIRREELDIDYDLIVDIGGGPGTKEATIQYLMLLIQSLYPIMEQRGIVDGSGWYSVFKDLLDEIGLKGTSAYLIDPNSEEGKQKILQQQQLIEKQKQEEREFELQKIREKANADIERAKIPRLGVYYSELPVDTQKQLLGEFGLRSNLQQLETEKIKEREYRAKRYGLFNQ